MPERDLWRKKLEFFNKELAIAADPEMKFKLILLIEECESKINPQSSHSTLTSLEKIYVKRNHLEEKCYQEIKKNGALLRINATEKMGKTSLIFNIIEYCQQHNMRVVRLSLRAFDLENIQQLESFLQCFCQEVSQALELNISVRDYWRTHGSLNNKSKCTSYFETYILNINKSPVVLAIDDVESLAPYPAVCQDFLSMLRSWYEAKTLIWQNLRLIISYSTEKFIEMQQDSYVSPFNVGLNIELPEFTLEEVQVLANYYKLPEDKVDVKRITDFVVGSPHLMKLAFSYIKNNPNYTFEEFLQCAPTQQGVYKDHLRRLLRILTKDLKIKEIYKNIVTSSEPVSTDPVIGDQLRRLGLIKWRGNQAIPSCEMYRQFFQANL